MIQKVVQELRRVGRADDVLQFGDFTFSNGSPGQLSVVAEFEAEELFALRGDKPFGFAPTARETFSTDGTGGNTETFTLSNSLIESRSTPDAVAAFIDDGSTVERISVDAVRFDADEIDVTDDGTDNTLVVFYTSGVQARAELRVVGPNGIRKTILEPNVDLVHRRDRFEQPLRLDFESGLEPVVPRSFRVQILIDAPYLATNIYEGSETVTAPNSILSVPIRRATSRVEGVARAVRQDIAQQ